MIAQISFSLKQVKPGFSLIFFNKKALQNEEKENNAQ
jgi:hypothetical protein